MIRLRFAPLKRSILGLVSLVLCFSPKLLAGLARHQVLGTGGLAVLNSTYRPVIPYHVNGLVDDAKLGADVLTTYQVKNTADQRKIATLENDYTAYTLLPLQRLARRNRPSGILLKVLSRGTSELLQHRFFVREQSVEKDLLTASVGVIISPSRDWMISSQIDASYETIWRRDVTISQLGQVEYLRTAKVKESAFMLNGELGYRLRLTEESSVAFVYRPKMKDHKGRARTESVSSLAESRVTKSLVSAGDPGFFSFGFKTRATKDATIGIGLKNSFRLKQDFGDGEGEISQAAKSHLSFGGETRHLAKNKIWIPRFGIDFVSDRSVRLNLGTSVQNDRWAFDSGLLLSTRKVDSYETHRLSMIIGVSYRADENIKKT